MNIKITPQYLLLLSFTHVEDIFDCHDQKEVFILLLLLQLLDYDGEGSIELIRHVLALLDNLYHRVGLSIEVNVLGVVAIRPIDRANTALPRLIGLIFEVIGCVGDSLCGLRCSIQ